MHWFSERKFSRSHAHFDCCFFFFFSQRISFAFARCYQKMHYFCLAAKNDFLSISLHSCTFGFFSLRFSLELFRLFNKPLFFFFCETSGLLNRFDELLKKRRRMYTGSEIPFRSTTARLFLKPGNARIRLYFWQESGRILNACRANRLRLFLFARLLAKIQSDWDLELGLNFSCCVC